MNSYLNYDNKVNYNKLRIGVRLIDELIVEKFLLWISRGIQFQIYFSLLHFFYHFAEEIVVRKINFSFLCDSINLKCVMRCEFELFERILSQQQ